jgi:hypothetical protein
MLLNLKNISIQYYRIQSRVHGMGVPKKPLYQYRILSDEFIIIAPIETPLPECPSDPASAVSIVFFCCQLSRSSFTHFVAP